MRIIIQKFAQWLECLILNFNPTQQISKKRGVQLDSDEFCFRQSVFIFVSSICIFICRNRQSAMGLSINDVMIFHLSHHFDFLAPGKRLSSCRNHWLFVVNIVIISCLCFDSISPKLCCLLCVKGLCKACLALPVLEWPAWNEYKNNILLLSKALFQTYWRTAISWHWREKWSGFFSASGQSSSYSD